MTLSPAATVSRRAAAATAVTACAAAAAACMLLTGCGGGAGNAASSSPGAARAPAATASPATPSPGGAAAFAGPRVQAPDRACADAVRAEHALQAGQGRDKASQVALDRDFTSFASRLGADAQRESSPTAARAMTNLANDYTALVESQTGGAQLPAMSTVENDGQAFSRACAAA